MARGQKASEAGDVGLLGADGFGGGAQGGEFGLGEIALDYAADAYGADLGLDAQVDAGDAVLAVQTGMTAPESSATARAIRAAAADGA
jgi:hypothetical protein